MTTKPKSVLAWAVCELDGTPIPMACSVGPTFPREFAGRSGRKVKRVRITVVRERKKKQAKKAKKRRRRTVDVMKALQRDMREINRGRAKR
jgi:hypothetical protein